MSFHSSKYDKHTLTTTSICKQNYHIFVATFIAVAWDFLSSNRPHIFFLNSQSKVSKSVKNSLHHEDKPYNFIIVS